MIKNVQSLMAKTKKLSLDTNISVNEILQNYMFERILERISVSKYRDNFILKGGLLLSSIMGINTRTTMDMDTCIKGIELSEEELYTILIEILNIDILNIDIDDNIIFEIKNSEPIREDDIYGGLKYNIVAKMENLRVNLSIDIATGDVITPREIEYDYKMIFEDRYLKIMTYNIETIIAEKFQTVIARGILNSRMKDYYDLYYLIKNESFSKNDLVIAIQKTFEKRETNMNNIEKIVKEIKKSDFVKNLWVQYSEKHKYVQNIQFSDVINNIEILIQLLNTQ